MTHKVENLLTGEIKEFKTDSKLIDYVYEIAHKAGDVGEVNIFRDNFSLKMAMDYLNTYCDNLLLL